MESDFNKHLGSQLRMRRLAMGLTQTKVAQAINVTFQQIQKYEKGTNGISSLRIMQLSNFLKVPVTYFFEDFPGYLGTTKDTDVVKFDKKDVQVKDLSDKKLQTLVDLEDFAERPVKGPTLKRK